MAGSRKGSISLSERVRVFANAGQFTTAEAAEALSEDRTRVQQAIAGCVQRGEIVRLARARFRLASVADAELHPVIKPRPPQGGEVQFRLNRAFMRLNDLREELDELRHIFGVAVRHVEVRPSFAMCSSSSELDS